MVHISDAELLRLSRSSRLAIPASLQDSVRNKLDAVLSYAEQLIAVKPQGVQHHNPDVAAVSLPLRSDTRGVSCAAALIALAPHHEDRYFVVPVVIAHDEK